MTAKKEPDIGPEQETDQDAIARLVADATGGDARGATLYLSRLDPRKGKDVHLCTYRPADFDIEVVRETFGGGDYRIRPRLAGGTYAKGSTSFSIDGPPRPTFEAPAPTPEPVPGFTMVAPALPAPDDVAGMLRALLVEMREQRAAPPPVADPIEIAARLGAVSASQFGHMVDMMGMKKDAPDGGGFERFMEAFQMGIKIGQDSEGGGNDYATALAPLIPLLGRIVEKQNAPAAPAAPPRPAPKVPIAAALDILLPMTDGNPEVWADVVVERVPGIVEAVESAFRAFGSVNGAVDSLVRFDGRVANHGPWFGTVIERILEYQPEAEPGAQGEEEAGDPLEKDPPLSDPAD